MEPKEIRQEVLTVLYIPFAIFLLNSSFIHSEIYDKVYLSQASCLEEVQTAITKAMEGAPEGALVKGGCLPLGEGVKPPVEPLKSPQIHKGPTTSL